MRDYFLTMKLWQFTSNCCFWGFYHTTSLCSTFFGRYHFCKVVESFVLLTLFRLPTIEKTGRLFQREVKINTSKLTMDSLAENRLLIVLSQLCKFKLFITQLKHVMHCHLFIWICFCSINIVPSHQKKLTSYSI